MATKSNLAEAHAPVIHQPIDDRPVSADFLQRQVNAIQEAMKGVMIKDVHYGVVPGCKKPSLWKPGAEKLCLMFRLRPEVRTVIRELANGHREYEVSVTLMDNAGQPLGQGVGLCSSMETKYRYRKGERKCPSCGQATIIKGKEQYGGGWLCYGKKGGCGAKFNDGDPVIEAQQVGDVENPDLADVYNTVLKMAKKRAFVDAVLTCTAASDIFDQDTEDLPDARYPGESPDDDPGVEIDQRPEPKFYYALKAFGEKFPADLPKAETLLKSAGAELVDAERSIWSSPKELSKLSQLRCAEPTHE